MAGYLPLEIEQYASFSRTITLRSANGTYQNLISGFANTSMKKSFYSSSSNTITTTITDGANGELTLSMTPEETANLTPGRYVYDVKLTVGSTVQRVVEGIVVVNPGVTS